MKPSSTQGLRRQSLKRGHQIVRTAQHRLALAVIPQPRGLQHRGQTKAHDGCPQVVQSLDNRPGCGCRPCAIQKGFLGDPVLADAQDRRVRANWLQGRQQIEPLGTDILELKADDIDRRGEFPQRSRVGIVADGRRMRHLGRRAVHLSRQDMATIAQARRRKRGHPPELPAADEPDRRIRCQWQHRLWPGRGRQRIPLAQLPLGSSATAEVCSARNTSRRVAKPASPIERIDAASNAAFTAPARPMAKVPTGMPVGI